MAYIASRIKRVMAQIPRNISMDIVRHRLLVELMLASSRGRLGRSIVLIGGSLKHENITSTSRKFIPVFLHRGKIRYEFGWVVQAGEDLVRLDGCVCAEESVCGGGCYC